MYAISKIDKVVITNITKNRNCKQCQERFMNLLRDVINVYARKYLHYFFRLGPKAALLILVLNGSEIPQNYSALILTNLKHIFT